MSVSDILARRFIGNNEQPSEGGLPPFVLNLLRSFGITPEAINAYADTMKNAIVGIHQQLSLISDRLDVIEQRQRGIEEKLAQVEHNVGALESDARFMTELPGALQTIYCTNGEQPLPVTTNDN